jgi:protein-S-isoprenylcysteine O-methyltransferase Ste14
VEDRFPDTGERVGSSRDRIMTALRRGEGARALPPWGRALYSRRVRASDWEFRNRAAILGAIFAVSYVVSPIDRVNAAVALGALAAPRLGLDADRAVRAIFALAAGVAALAALLRTWASAYLAADVVYAGAVKTTALVADGPYRFVRNPLYLANQLLAVAMGTLASRFGFLLMNGLMLVFSYRLILREEDELAADQGGGYAAYRARVPRLVPSPAPRVASAGRPARWVAGFTAEAWYWGFAIAVGVFAATLSVPAFLALVAASVATLFFK